MTLSMNISNITKVAIAGLLTFAATTSAQAQASVNQKEFGQEYIDAIAVATPYVSKRPAVEERLFRSKVIEQCIKDMKKRLKDNTWHTKEHILRTKLIPFFGKRKMCDIQPKDVIAWQNEMLEGSTKTGKPYSPVYLKTLHNQLSAVFNYAVKFYGLPSNPAAKAGNMGKAKNREMLFWTQEEYKQFAEVMMDKPVSFYAFEMLYWCGIREGELLALTPADFDFERQTVSITKSYQRIKGQDIITDPKTAKSNRVVKMPDFLSQEIQDFIGQLYGIAEHDRMFMITKSYLHHEMDRGAKESGVKRIRIHDLRHSHISLLIEMGFSAVAIADRVGHESIDITYRYAHLFPSTQNEMADRLSDLRSDDAEVTELLLSCPKIQSV